MGELGKITKNKDVSLEIKVMIIHTLPFPITVDSKEGWWGKKNNSLEIQCWRRALRRPQTTSKMNSVGPRAN